MTIATFTSREIGDGEANLIHELFSTLTVVFHNKEVVEKLLI